MGFSLKRFHSCGQCRSLLLTGRTLVAAEATAIDQNRPKKQHRHECLLHKAPFFHIAKRCAGYSVGFRLSIR